MIDVPKPPFTGDPELDALWLSFDDARKQYLCAVRARFPHKVRDTMPIPGGGTVVIRGIEPMIGPTGYGFVNVKSKALGIDTYPIHAPPRLPYDATEFDG